MRDILVYDGHIVALLDWELSGFYPEYWEFANARRGIKWRDLTLVGWCTFLDTLFEAVLRTGRSLRSDLGTDRVLKNSWLPGTGPHTGQLYDPATPKSGIPRTP